MKIYNLIKKGMFKGWVLMALSLACFFLSIATFEADSYAYNEDTNEYVIAANEALQPILEREDILGSIYLTRTFEVKAEPDETSQTVRTVKSGQLVYIIGVDMDEEYQVWNRVRILQEDGNTEGYVLRENIACSNLRFLDWEAEYGMDPDYWNGSMSVMAVGDDEAENDVPISPADLYEDIKLFPESYQSALIALKQIHPNWQFVAVETDIDFSTAINSEIGDKSWVSGSLYKSYSEGLAGQKNWYYASPETIEFYMDPRTALTEERIFQFEQLTFNPEVHNVEDLATFLEGTFMADGNQIPGLNAHAGNWYSNYLMAFCNSFSENISLSPYYVAARIIQEQGKNGSVMISGTVPGYEGLYNYFNIGASGKTDSEVIANGLTYAKNHGWTSGYYALLGGCKFLYNDYVSIGQDTLYSQKFNYVNGKFSHQYMQNVTAAITEGTSTYSMYKKNDKYNTIPFVFKIPVYNNMPATPIEKPVTTTKFIITLPDGYASLGVSATPDVWVDGVKKSSVKRNGYLVIDSENNSSKVALVNKYGSDGFESGMYIWFLDYANGAYTVTREEELDDLLTYWGFSIRIVEPSGIRFMSGIKETTKDKLKTSGIDGYMLSEYGTIVTTANIKEADGTDRVFIKGISGVAAGVSYGAATNYTEKNNDTVEGYSRYAAVFKGLPVSVYKTDFNFRSYAIVTKNGVDRIIYGPYYGKNIYDLAKRVLASKKYEEGSDNYNFISKIIYDADHLGE